MIKELKVNFYRILRSKAFIVIAILLLIGAVISSLEIKFVADDPFGLYEKDTAVDIQEGLRDDASMEEKSSSALSIYAQNIKDLPPMNNLTGPVSVTLCVDAVSFLLCVFVALYVGGEFKSRFHVNHYSVNTSRTMVVFLEWLSLMITIFLLEAVCYFLTLGISVIICDSYSFSDMYRMFKHTLLVGAIMMTFTSFSFMIAFVRRAGALAIVLSACFVFGFVDMIYLVISIWIPWFEYFSLNAALSSIAIMSISRAQYAVAAVVSVLCIALFLSTAMIVSSKRDPY